ncbi:MAG: hypothetical protein ACP5RS_06605 [Thermoplasmata archaeon]
MLKTILNKVNVGIFIGFVISIMLIISIVPVSIAANERIEKYQNTSTSWLQSSAFSTNNPWQQTYLLTSTVYTVNLVIDVPSVPNSQTQFYVNLTNLAYKNGNAPIWTFGNSYAGITNVSRSETYDNSIQFSSSAGTLQLTGSFIINTSVVENTIKYPNGQSNVVDNEKQNVNIITISWGGISEGVVGPYSVIDANIQTYISDLQKIIAMNNIPMEYQPMVNQTVQNAKYLASYGMYVQANALLSTIINGNYTTSSTPTSNSSSSLSPFTIELILGILVAVGFILFILMFLSNSKMKNEANRTKSLREELITDISRLEVQADKMDRRLGNELRNIESKLKEQ